MGPLDITQLRHWLISWAIKLKVCLDSVVLSLVGQKPKCETTLEMSVLKCKRQPETGECQKIPSYNPLCYDKSRRNLNYKYNGCIEEETSELLRISSNFCFDIDNSMLIAVIIKCESQKSGIGI